jgi:hypothetical protein
MRQLILTTGADNKYYNNSQFKNYLKSISNNSNFDKNIIVYLDNNNTNSDYSNIEVYQLNPTDVVYPNPNNCLQHGEFLKAKEFTKFSN